MNEAEKLKIICDQQKRAREQQQQREEQRRPDPFLEGLTGKKGNP